MGILVLVLFTIDPPMVKSVYQRLFDNLLLLRLYQPLLYYEGLQKYRRCFLWISYIFYLKIPVIS